MSTPDVRVQVPPRAPKDETLQTVRLQGFSCICKGKRGFESPRYGSEITEKGKKISGSGTVNAYENAYAFSGGAAGVLL